MQEVTPDKLLDTITITLTEAQCAYLDECKDDPRTLLLKKFNMKFATSYSKLQLTNFIALHKPKSVQTGIKAGEKPRNVYPDKRENAFFAQVMVNGVRHILCRGSEAKCIKAVENYRESEKCARATRPRGKSK